MSELFTDIFPDSCAISCIVYALYEANMRAGDKSQNKKKPCTLYGTRLFLWRALGDSNPRPFDS